MERKLISSVSIKKLESTIQTTQEVFDKKLYFELVIDSKIMFTSGMNFAEIFSEDMFDDEGSYLRLLGIRDFGDVSIKSTKGFICSSSKKILNMFIGGRKPAIDVIRTRKGIYSFSVKEEVIIPRYSSLSNNKKDYKSIFKENISITTGDCFYCGDNTIVMPKDGVTGLPGVIPREYFHSITYVREGQTISLGLIDIRKTLTPVVEVRLIDETEIIIEIYNK